MTEDDNVVEEENSKTAMSGSNKLDAKFLILEHLRGMGQLMRSKNYSRKTYKESVDFLARIVKQVGDDNYKIFKAEVKKLQTTLDKDIKKLGAKNEDGIKKLGEHPSIIDRMNIERSHNARLDALYKKFYDEKFEKIIELLDKKELLLESETTERVRASKKWKNKKQPEPGEE